LRERSETLNPGELVSFTINVGVVFLALKALFTLPRAALKNCTILQPQIHIPLPGAVYMLLGLEAHSSLREEELTYISKLRFADVILKAYERNLGARYSSEATAP
jgi:hypothetical protein